MVVFTENIFLLLGFHAKIIAQEKRRMANEIYRKNTFVHNIIIFFRIKTATKEGKY